MLYNPGQLARGGGRDEAAILSRNKAMDLAGFNRKLSSGFRV